MAIDALGFDGGAAGSEPPSPEAYSGYPVEVEFRPAGRRKRVWAIPMLGAAVKTIILIPHLLIVGILGWLAGLYLSGAVGGINAGGGQTRDATFWISAAVGTAIGLAGAQLVLWMWVLLGGRYPDWGRVLVGGTLRWFVRVSAFGLGLTDQYPPFSFRSGPEDGEPYDVQVVFHVPDRSNRWWAVPIFGWAAKIIVCIPHFICLYAMGVASSVAVLIAWVPVLFTGHYPSWAHGISGGWLRWWARLYAFLLGLTDRYPPFSPKSG